MMIGKIDFLNLSMEARGLLSIMRAGSTVHYRVVPDEAKIDGKHKISPEFLWELLGAEQIRIRPNDEKVGWITYEAIPVKELPNA